MQGAKLSAKSGNAPKGSVSWNNETRSLDELVPWEFNPRQIDEAHGKRLIYSREKFGQVAAVAIGPDNELYDGHQRLKQWAQAFGPGFVVDVRVASRSLTEAERQELAVLLHEGAVGKFNFDALADWPDVDVPQLLEWGLSPFQLGIDVDLQQPDEVDPTPTTDELHGPPGGLRRCPQCGYEW